VVITVSDSIAEYLRRFNIATEILYNCPKAEEIPRLSKREARIQLGLPLEAFIVSSMGAIRPDCRFDLLLDVALRTRSPNIQYVIVGNGPLATQFRKDAKQAGANLMALPAVPRERALMYVLASDLTWAIYQNRPESMNPRMTIPWKFFESLACGVPVLVDPGTMRATLVNRYGCGLVLQSDDSDSISRTIDSLAHNRLQHQTMCSRAKDAVDSGNFKWETMSAKLIGLYDRLEKCGLPS
jgi:glycosyltransferase involved in cell wall biosynthesis